MKAPLPCHSSPRCAARSKRTRKLCRAPAVAGWNVCRFHGAGGGAPKAKRNGMYRHGEYTSEAIAERKALANLIRHVRQTFGGV